MSKKTIYTKQYYENFALNVLKKYYPDKFSKFEKHECPDWLCGKVGLEITRAVSTQDGEMDAFIKDCQGKEFSEINAERLMKLGFSVELTKSNCDHFYETRSPKNGLLSFLHTKDNRFIFYCYFSRMGMVNECIDDILYAVKEKLKKLNHNYERLEENDLAILVPEQLNYIGAENIVVSDIIKELSSGIKTVYSETQHVYTFRHIFIVFFDNFFSVDTKTFECNRIEIHGDDLLQLSKESIE